MNTVMYPVTTVLILLPNSIGGAQHLPKGGANPTKGAKWGGALSIL